MVLCFRLFVCSQGENIFDNISKPQLFLPFFLIHDQTIVSNSVLLGGIGRSRHPLVNIWRMSRWLGFYWSCDWSALDYPDRFDQSNDLLDPSQLGSNQEKKLKFNFGWSWWTWDESQIWNLIDAEFYGNPNPFFNWSNWPANKTQKDPTVPKNQPIMHNMLVELGPVESGPSQTQLGCPSLVDQVNRGAGPLVLQLGAPQS